MVTDLGADHQSLTEMSHVNLPTTALCNTDSVDIAIPCMMLAPEVLCMRDTISNEHLWEVMPDLLQRPGETEEKQAAAEKTVTKEEFQGEWTVPASEVTVATQRWQAGLRVCRCPLYPYRSSLLKAGVLMQPLRTGQ